MLPTGRCRNCSDQHRIFSATCVEVYIYIRCNRCYRYLPTYLSRNDDDMCNACQNRDVHNVGRYAHDCLIGDRRWTGTLGDMSVGDFIQRIGGDVMSTYETAVVENIAIKYNLEMTVDFQQTTQDGYVQNTSGRFFIPTTTPDM